MFTDNKIHVAERDVAVLARTVSGGVNEPSDPKHFPVLGNSATSPRAMSRLHSSFKDRLLTDSRDASDNTGQSAADGTEAARATSRADYTRNTSPKIAAGRDFTQEILSAASSEASGCGAEGGQKRNAMPVGAQRDPQGEGWEPVSPRKHVSQRRRTADEQADRAAKAGTVFDIPGHQNTFGALGDVDENVSQVSSDTKLHEEMDGKGSTYQGLSAGSSGMNADGGVWGRVEAGMHWVVENPVKAATMVGLTAVGAMVVVRRRRLF